MDKHRRAYWHETRLRKVPSRMGGVTYMCAWKSWPGTEVKFRPISCGCDICRKEEDPLERTSLG